MSVDTIKSAMRVKFKLPENADVRLMASCVTIKAMDDDPYKFTARITTDSVDRQDEVVIPEGGNLTEFYNSGALFWNHQYDQPVGFPNKAKKAVRTENAIECGGVFMKRPPDFEGEFFPDFARAFITQAQAAGVAPGVSIGFIPLESRRPTKLDVQKYGDRVQVVHSKWKLLEFSIAPVQANQDAVVTVVGKQLEAKAEPIKIVAPMTPKIITASLCVVKRPEIDQSVRRYILKTFGRMYA